jgi:hypothetical protein
MAPKEVLLVSFTIKVRLKQVAHAADASPRSDPLSPDLGTRVPTGARWER